MDGESTDSNRALADAERFKWCARGTTSLTREIRLGWAAPLDKLRAAAKTLSKLCAGPDKSMIGLREPASDNINAPE
jgi:hypothetical protein